MRIKHPFIFFVGLILIFLCTINATSYAETRLTNGTASAYVTGTGDPLNESMFGPIENIFDSDLNTHWGFGADPTSFPGTVIEFSLPSPEIVTKYRIVGWGLGSWVLLAAVPGGSPFPIHGGTSSDLGQELTISNTTAFSTYYLVIYDITDIVFSITELEYYASDAPSTPPATPATPTGPSTDDNGSYTISWGAVSGATSYQLQENLNGGTWSTVYNSSGTSTTRSGRSPGTWNYRVRATNSVGSSSYSNTKTVLVAPAVPSAPTGPSTDYDGSYSISWGSVTGATSYTLQQNFMGGDWSTVYTDSSTSASFTVSTAGYWVYRVSACGVTCSDYSDAMAVLVTPPPVPGGLSGPSTDYDGSYTISWSAVTGATSYQLQENLNGGAWSTVYDNSGTSTTRSGRSPGTWNYRVRVTSYLGSSSYSSTVTVLVAPAVPGTPTGPSTDYDGSYTISWSVVTGASSYTLQEQLNSGAWSTVYTGSSTSTSITGRSAGTWGYRVNACGATCSTYSSTKNVIVSGPSVPGTLTGPATNPDGNYTISWGAATGATSYQLEEGFIGEGTWSTVYNSTGLSTTRSGMSPGVWFYRVKASNPVGSSGYSNTVSVMITPPIPGTPTGPSVNTDGSYTISWSAVSGAASYQLQEKSSGGDWSTIYDGSGTSKSRSGRSPGYWYYRVRATNPLGSSDYSSTKTVLVLPIPAPPIGPWFPDYDGSYTISWSAVTGATSYTLQEQYPGGDWSTVYTGSSTSASITDRFPPGLWGYRIKVCAGGYCTDYSDTSTVAVMFPPAPGGFTGPSTDADGSYIISWSAVPDASSYTLQEQLNSGAWSTVYTGSSTIAPITGNSAGTWGYRVNACGVACSPYSGTKKVIVSPPVSATYTFDYDANGNMTSMDKDE